MPLWQESESGLWAWEMFGPHRTVSCSFKYLSAYHNFRHFALDMALKGRQKGEKTVRADDHYMEF